MPGVQLPLPAFLSSKSSPTLEHLSLVRFNVHSGFLTQSKLRTLELKNVVLSSSSPAVLFSQSLTRLTIFGVDTAGWLLEPDSIKIPVFRSLILLIDDPKKLLAPILAPVLEYINYSRYFVQDPDSVVSSRVKNKFGAVHHLALSLGDKSYNDTCGVAWKYMYLTWMPFSCIMINSQDRRDILWVTSTASNK